MMGSPIGGMDIEELVEINPNQIHTIPIDIVEGIQKGQSEKMAKLLGFKGSAIKDAQEQIHALYEMLIGEDALQVEINPFVQTKNFKTADGNIIMGKVYCVDAKIDIDENAAFRHKELFAKRDFTMEDPREVEASQINLNYIGLDGHIGCLVNGAGLAMATMDIIKLYGSTPANFLDVGGRASVKQVKQAFRILTKDPEVHAILVNIFGGIMKCDVIARGIVQAASNLNLSVPLIVRLEGTRMDIGKRILADSGLNIILANNLDEAAAKAVAAVS